jgi:hypothetical protein
MGEPEAQKRARMGIGLMGYICGAIAGLAMATVAVPNDVELNPVTWEDHFEVAFMALVLLWGAMGRLSWQP